MLATLLSMALLGQSGDIVIKYDEVRDNTMEYIMLRDVYTRSENDLTIGLMFSEHYTGKDRIGVLDQQKIGFMIASRSDSWEFLKYNSASVFYDGTRKQLDESSVSREVETGYVTEHFHYQATFKNVKEMANAKDVRFAIGGTTFSLSEDQKAKLSEFCEQLSVSTDEMKALEARRAKEKEEKLAEMARQEEEQRKNDEIAAKKRAEADKVRLNESSAISDIEMAQRFIKLGKKAVAEEWLRKAIGRKPSEEVAKKAEALLKSVKGSRE